MLTAITREVSEGIDDCQLTYLPKERIDYQRAKTQHRLYRQLLSDLGVNVMVLPALDHLPDAVFVEDPVVVLDEVAVMAPLACDTRRDESEAIKSVIEEYRSVIQLTFPATLDGGDVLRINRTLYVGLSKRTNREAVAQLQKILSPLDYAVIPAHVKNCLHYKTGCSFLGNNTVLANKEWVDTSAFHQYDLIPVDKSEPFAGNALYIGDTVIHSSSFPKTQTSLRERGFDVRTVDISELEKAEAGVTCLSILMDTNS